MSLAASYAHCEAQLRAEDHDAWLATLFAPADARPHLHAIGAFALEVAHVRRRVRQPIAGEIRLQWWQDVVDGERTAEAAAHPVAAALLDTMARAALPAAPVGDMLDAFRMGLHDEPPADLPALERRLIATHGTPVRLAARVLGGGSAVDSAADDAGVALGIAALLDGLGRGDPVHRVPMPADLLGRHGSHQGEVDLAQSTPALRSVLAELRDSARARLSSLRRRRSDLGAAGPAFLTTALVEPRLDLDVERLSAPSGTSRDVSPLRRQWRMWRAARKGGVL